MKSPLPLMPDNLQDTVHYARQWKEGFSDMHPHGHISWWVTDIATKFTLNRETLAEIMEVMVLSWQGSWSLRMRLRLHVDLTLQFRGNCRTRYTTNSRFFQPKPSEVNGETDFFKTVIIFMLYILLLFFF